MALCMPRASSSVPVRRPRWMNCITSATETSLRLPEIPMGFVWGPRLALTPRAPA